MESLAILLTNPRRTEFTQITVPVSALTGATQTNPWAKLVTHLEAGFRKARTPLTKGLVCSVIGASKTDQQARAVMTIHSHYVVLERQGVETVIRFKDAKPGINEIRDFRQKPAPFLRDGSCSG